MHCFVELLIFDASCCNREQVAVFLAGCFKQVEVGGRPLLPGDHHSCLKVAQDNEHLFRGPVLANHKKAVSSSIMLGSSTPASGAVCSGQAEA